MYQNLVNIRIYMKAGIMENSVSIKDEKKNASAIVCKRRSIGILSGANSTPKIRHALLLFSCEQDET